jgi:hypothetical protein
MLGLPDKLAEQLGGRFPPEFEPVVSPYPLQREGPQRPLPRIVSAGPDGHAVEGPLAAPRIKGAGAARPPTGTLPIIDLWTMTTLRVALRVGATLPYRRP